MKSKMNVISKSLLTAFTVSALSISTAQAAGEIMFAAPSDLSVGANPTVTTNMKQNGTVTTNNERFVDGTNTLNFSVNDADVNNNLVITSRFSKSPLMTTLTHADGRTEEIDTGETNKFMDINIKTADDMKLNSVTTTTSTSDKFTTTNGTVNITDAGADFGNTIVKNVAAGEVSATSTDAINGSQLFNVLQNVNNGGTGTNVELYGDKNITVTTSDSGDYKNISLNPDVNINSVSIGDPASTKLIHLEKDKVNFGNNVINNIKNGSVTMNSTDAIAGNQLHTSMTSMANIIAGPTHLDSSKIKVENTGYLSLNKPLINGTALYNVAASLEYLNKKNYGWSIGENPEGTAQADKKLNPLGTNSDVNFVAGKNVTSKLIHQVTGSNDFGCPVNNPPDYRNARNAPLNPESWCKGDSHSAIVSYELNDDIDLNSVTANHLNIKGGAVSINNNGIQLDNKKIEGVQNGDINSTSKDAVNGSQVHNSVTSIKNVIGGNSVVNKDGTVSTSNIGNTGKNNIHDAIDSIRTSVAKPFNFSVGQNQFDAKKEDKTLHDMNRDSDLNFNAGKNLKATLKHKTDENGNSAEVIYELQDDISVNSVTAKNEIKVGDKVTINNKGIDLKGGDINGMNTIEDISLTENDKKGVNVETLRNALKDKDSLVKQNENGDITIGAKTGGDRINVSNVNGEPRVIGGVADAKNNDEAVNLGQLKDLDNKLSKDIADVDDSARSGIAGVAAAAALPQVFEYGRNLVAIGVGHYKGKQAVAAGFSAATDNGKHIVKVQGSVGLQDTKSATIGAGYGYMW